MEPEDKTQEIAERAERLQEIGSSILRAARDELYLVRFLTFPVSVVICAKFLFQICKILFTQIPF